MNPNRVIYHSGLIVPKVGLGTFNLQGTLAYKTILEAYEEGYRLIDTATNYFNHKDISPAIIKLPRDELRISSKLNESDIAVNGVKKSCELILSELKISYLDILFLHHPKVGFLPEVMQAMLDLRENGLIRSIGVSNFSCMHLLEIKDFLSFVDVNQVEAHPLCFQPALYDFCDSRHIQVMAYRPFANGQFADKKIIQTIADKHNKSGRQVILRWLLQNNMQVIPKASSVAHLRENYAVFDFELSGEEMKALMKI